MLSKSIDAIEEKHAVAARLKQKLTAFLNQDKAIENYILKEKSDIVCSLRKAQQQRKQILLVNYASGNSQTVKNRMVEPFEFKDDFNLVWAFDTVLKQNRQFKICRIEDVQETLIPWENERSHHSKPVDVFRNTGDLNKQIELKMNLKARNLLIEEYPLSERHLEKIGNNQFRLNIQVAKYEGPGRFVLGLIDDIQVTGDNGFYKQATIWFKKGSKSLVSQNNPGKAAKYFDKALEYLPYEKNILYLRGMVRLLMNNKDGAKKDFDRMSSLDLIDMSGEKTTQNITKVQSGQVAGLN